MSMEELEGLRDLKSVLSKLLARVGKVKACLDRILCDDHEMAAMYLGRRAALEQAAAAETAARARSDAHAASQRPPQPGQTAATHQEDHGVADGEVHLCRCSCTT